MNDLLGMMYFTPDLDEKTGKPTSRYEGIIVGFTVQRDNGEEFEVRRDRTIHSRANRPLTLADMKNLTEGQPIMLAKSPAVAYTITKVIENLGDVWIQDESGKVTAVKYHELKRVPS